MAYSQTKVIIGGLAHVPILIFIFNLIKGKFASKAVDLKVDEVKVKETKIKLAEPKKKEIKPEDDQKIEVKEEVLAEEGQTEDGKKIEDKEEVLAEEGVTEDEKKKWN